MWKQYSGLSSVFGAEVTDRFEARMFSGCGVVDLDEANKVPLVEFTA